MTPTAHTHLQPQPPSDETAQAQRASVAVGVAPWLVLLGFTAVICGWIEPGTGLAIFAACTAWVVYEMYRYQDRIADSTEEALGPWL